MSKSKYDLPTIIAIAVIAYMVANVLHEGAGHGGTCLLIGGKPISLSTAYFEWEEESVSTSQRRMVAAGGALANLAFGFICWGLFRWFRNVPSTWRFFLWLSMAVNLMTATGYPLFSGVIGVGDWIAVVKGFEPRVLWRLILIFSGMVLYLLSVWISLRELSLLVGGRPQEQKANGGRLSLVSYLAGSISATVGSFLNPISPILVATSAAAHFGGTSGLAWMTQFYKRGHFLGLPLPEREEPEVQIRSSLPWQIAGAVLMLAHIMVLGPSIHF